VSLVTILKEENRELTLNRSWTSIFTQKHFWYKGKNTEFAHVKYKRFVSFYKWFDVNVIECSVTIEFIRGVKYRLQKQKN